MAVTVFGIDNFYTYLPVGGGGIGVAAPTYVYPFPIQGGTVAQYANRVWDTQANGGAGGYVIWETYYMDLGGQHYPGPGAFGVDTSEYKVRAITHTRDQ